MGGRGIEEGREGGRKGNRGIEEEKERVGNRERGRKVNGGVERGGWGE